MNDDRDIAPPWHPPPMLSAQETEYLITQGHLSVAIPATLQDNLTKLINLGNDFFSHDKDTKLAKHPPSRNTESGYYDVADEKEYVTFRSITSAEKASEFDILAQQTWQASAALLCRILYDLSTAIGIPYEAWTPLLDGCLQIPEGDVDDSLPSLLRVFKYMPDKGFAGKHTDNGILTLCDGRDKGLQVWVSTSGDAQSASQGFWKDAEGPTVLVGDTLRVLSYSRIPAARHRVVKNEAGRNSIVFALRPSLRAAELDLSPFGEPGNSVNPAWFYKQMHSRKKNINQRKPNTATEGTG